MPDCECGCGAQTVNGQFLPGHDQKLRSQLEEMTGGLLNLRDLVTNAHQYSIGMINLPTYGKHTKELME